MTTITKLPAANYTVELLTEYEGSTGHFYKTSLDNEVWGGVTGVLDTINTSNKTNALMGWAKKLAVGVIEDELRGIMASGQEFKITEGWIKALAKKAKARPQKAKEDAGDYGTRCHAIIDRYVKGEDPGEIPAELEDTVLAFRRWWKESGFTFIAGDTKVASRIYKYGGSLDALAADESGRIILLDWKTSNRLSEVTALQLCAYSQGLAETYGVTPHRQIVVRFGKDAPEFEVKEVENYNKSFSAWTMALGLTRAMRFSHWK